MQESCDSRTRPTSEKHMRKRITSRHPVKSCSARSTVCSTYRPYISSADKCSRPWSCANRLISTICASSHGRPAEDIVDSQLRSFPSAALIGGSAATAEVIRTGLAVSNAPESGRGGPAYDVEGCTPPPARPQPFGRGVIHGAARRCNTRCLLSGGGDPGSVTSMDPPPPPSRSPEYLRVGPPPPVNCSPGYTAMLPCNAGGASRGSTAAEAHAESGSCSRKPGRGGKPATPPCRICLAGRP